MTNYKRTINDEKYIKSLADAIDTPCENLNSIVGLDELKNILKNASFQNFNPNSEEYCINLHTHSQFSDGAASVEEILDEAQSRARNSQKTFLIGITDHDCLDGARYLIKLIASNPEKYDKIKVMAGVEPCFKYENPNIFKMPIPFDAIIYCVNPFEKNTIELFETYTNKNRDYSRLIMHKVNQRWAVNASYEESCNFHCLLKTGGSSGFFKFTRKYVEHLLDKAGIIYSPIEILEIFKPFFANQNGRATLATENINDAVKKLSAGGFSQIGIAHPALLELNPKFEEGWDFESVDNLLDGITYDEALIEFLKSCNLSITETNYIYPEKYYTKYPQLKHLTEIVKTVCDKLQMIQSGGTDSHGNTHGKILLGRY